MSLKNPKTLSFPIRAVQFKKQELHFIMDGLTDVIATSLHPFGDTADFRLTLDLTYLPRGDKTNPWKPSSR